MWIGERFRSWQAAARERALSDPLAIFRRPYHQPLSLGKNRLLIVDDGAASAPPPRLPGFKRLICSHTKLNTDGSTVIAYLQRLSRKQHEICIMSAAFASAALRSSEALRLLATTCSGRVWFAKPALTMDERQLRLALHQAGFYEVLDCYWGRDGGQPVIRFDTSSIGIYPDGPMQWEGSQAGVIDHAGGDWLVASRLPHPHASAMHWSAVYGLGKRHEDGSLSACEENQPTLWVCDASSGASVAWTSQRISGQFRWPSPVQAHESGSLVGCYHGPGDTNMYLAMVTPLPNQYVEFALWRGVDGWNRVTHVILPESQCATALEGHASGCNREVSVTMEITRDHVRLILGEHPLLEIEDRTLARGAVFGARMHSPVLRLGQINSRTF